MFAVYIACNTQDHTVWAHIEGKVVGVDTTSNQYEVCFFLFFFCFVTTPTQAHAVDDFH